MELSNIESVDIDAQMRSAYIDYAMSVIVARALPDARDGLKPVHRRILYAMYDMGMRANTAYKKSARIVGEVLGKYHPHGDSAVYESMARMAQDFSMRYPLVDGQGNFGSIDGDSPAAMRYTEARLQNRAQELLADIEMNTVDFADNFDGTLQEPLVLPARLPNLLLNGSTGIAVGMATSIPPHNMREIIAAVDLVIENFDNLDDVTVDDLMNIVQGPDFPTGGEIMGREGIRQAYSTGRSRLTVRGVAKIEEARSGRYNIVITEIPYLLNKTSLIERIVELVHEGRLDMVSDLRDESDQHGMGIVVELKRGAQPRKVLNQLFKFTALQSTFSVQMLALVDNEPRLLPLKRALQIFVEHRQEVVTRRTRFELDKARRRQHILDGLLIALANLDAVIQTIRQADDVDQAREQLMSRFSLSEVQAQAILDMQLRRLAALERMKIEEEHRQMAERIAFMEDLLANPQKILNIIRQDLKELGEKYGDERRTRISADTNDNSLNEEDLVADESVLITLTKRGYIKRVNTHLYRVQNRGGRGVMGQGMREEDEVERIIPARTLHTVLFFSDKGKVYSQRVYQIPEAGRADRGVPVVNILALEANEHITAAVSVADFVDTHYCIMATVLGKVKRVALSEFASVRPSGLIAVNLEDGDRLGWARVTSGKDDILLVTEQGQALRFHEGDVRSMGRQATGVNGIALHNDRVQSMEVVEPGGYLLVITALGFGKRTPLDEYPVHGRATKGIHTIDPKGIEKIGLVVSARVVQLGDELTIITTGGQALRMKVQQVSESSRATRGVHLINVSKDDTVASVARIAAADIDLDHE